MSTNFVFQGTMQWSFLFIQQQPCFNLVSTASSTFIFYSFQGSMKITEGCIFPATLNKALMCFSESPKPFETKEEAEMLKKVALHSLRRCKRIFFVNKMQPQNMTNFPRVSFFLLFQMLFRFALPMPFHQYKLAWTPFQWQG